MEQDKQHQKYYLEAFKQQAKAIQRDRMWEAITYLGMAIGFFILSVFAIYGVIKFLQLW